MEFASLLDSRREGGSLQHAMACSSPLALPLGWNPEVRSIFAVFTLCFECLALPSLESSPPGEEGALHPPALGPPVLLAVEAVAVRLTWL